MAKIKLVATVTSDRFNRRYSYPNENTQVRDVITSLAKVLEREPGRASRLTVELTDPTSRGDQHYVARMTLEEVR